MRSTGKRFEQEITKLWHESRNATPGDRKVLCFPKRGRLSNLSLERFRTTSKYQDRPAAADIVFCVVA
jgi:hypothetical protein